MSDGGLQCFNCCFFGNVGFVVFGFIGCSRGILRHVLGFGRVLVERDHCLCNICVGLGLCFGAVSLSVEQDYVFWGKMRMVALHERLHVVPFGADE